MDGVLHLALLATLNQEDGEEHLRIRRAQLVATWCLDFNTAAHSVSHKDVVLEPERDLDAKSRELLETQATILNHAAADLVLSHAEMLTGFALLLWAPTRSSPTSLNN